MVRLVLGLIALLGVVGGGLIVLPAAQTATARPSRVGRIVPAEATIEPLARPVPGGNAVLRVRFEPGTRLPVRIPYETESGPVVLADDGRGFDQRAGDGLYTALGTIDVAATRARLVQLSQSRTAVPTRTWRHRSKVPVGARIDVRGWLPGRRFGVEPWGDPVTIDPARSLMITDLAVVEDPSRTRASCDQPSMGPWSFGYLMDQMANTPITGVTGSQLARAWLDRWLTGQTVNGFGVSPRALMQSEIIDPWVAASGGASQPLDLSKAPFKLLAIVNRLDLRDQVAYAGTFGGEVRFVFALQRPGCAASGRPFEVIFEFRVPASGCVNLKAWAAQWRALDGLPLGSPSYNAALEAITQQVVVANAGGSRANGSALNQIRTNEDRLDATGEGLDWEAREFRLDGVTHLLRADTLAQTPDTWLRFDPSLAAYVNANATAIKHDEYLVPLNYPVGHPFRAGTLVYTGTTSTWDSASGTPITDRDARHHFSLNTCSGCHYNETASDFTHVAPRPFGTAAALSKFLTGGWVDDAADKTPGRYFSDLERRAVDMDALLHTSCFAIPLDLPLMAISH